MTNETPTAAGTGADGSRGTAQDTGEAARAKAADHSSQAERLAERARTAAGQKGEEEKARAASGLADTAEALRDSSQRLRAGSPQQKLLGEAASGLETLSKRMESRSLGEMASDVSDFARRHPAAFLGGAALAGFALARFARASGRQRADDEATATSASQGGAAAGATPSALAAGRRPPAGDERSEWKGIEG